MDNKPKEKTTIGYLGIIDAYGAVHASSMDETLLHKKTHEQAGLGPFSNPQARWRYKQSTNTLEFWSNPNQETKDIILNWLWKRHITEPNIRILVPYK